MEERESRLTRSFWLSLFIAIGGILLLLGWITEFPW